MSENDDPSKCVEGVISGKVGPYHYRPDQCLRTTHNIRVKSEQSKQLSVRRKYEFIRGERDLEYESMEELRLAVRAAML